MEILAFISNRFFIAKIDQHFGLLDVYANFTSSIIPLIAKLDSKSAPYPLAVKYFSIIGCIIPVFVAWLAHGDDLDIRIRYAKAQRSQTNEMSPLVYIASLSMLIFVICSIVLGIGLSTNPGTAGGFLYR